MVGRMVTALAAKLAVAKAGLTVELLVVKMVVVKVEKLAALGWMSVDKLGYLMVGWRAGW